MHFLERIIQEQIREIWHCFPDWGRFVVVYHCWLIAIDHRCEPIEISRGWDMGWISGYSCSHLMRFLKSLPRLGWARDIRSRAWLCSRVCVGSSPLPALGADTLTGNISNICHQLPILPHTTAHSSLQLQSSISTKEMKTRLEFYMHRAIHHLPASLSCWFKKVERKISSKSSLDSP